MFSGQVGEMDRRWTEENEIGRLIWWAPLTLRDINVVGTFYSPRGTSTRDVNYTIPSGTNFCRVVGDGAGASGYVRAMGGYLYCRIEWTDLSK